MNKEINKKTKYFISIIICTIVVLLFQILYLKVCDYCYQITNNYIVDPSGNIIEHFYMFLFVFIITYFLYKTKKIDFGYHSFKIKEIIKFLIPICIFYLCSSLIDAIFGVKEAFNIGLFWTIVFQMFFSGLGEEIIYRSIPMRIFDKYLDGYKKFFEIKGIKIDLSMILSSILFSLWHIPNFINLPIYAVVYGLLSVFISGMIYSWIYRKTNSIWLCMIVHGLSNVIMFVFPVISGLIFGM